jgi:hypothetical protein
LANEPTSYRQNHSLMLQGATKPISGEAVDDHVAASGGLDLPPGEIIANPPARVATRARERFPGEREPDTLVNTQPGAVGGIGFGASLPPTDVEDTMDERTRLEHRREGGITVTPRRD